MSNNMDLGYEMFCYQCEQTANGKGCTRLGVCGKTPEIANLQDLLIFQLKGISCYGKVLIEKVSTLTRTLFALWKLPFTTLTNVNFDADVHVSLCVNLSKSRKNFVKLWAKSKSYYARNLQSSRNKVGNAQRRTACGNYVRKVA